MKIISYILTIPVRVIITLLVLVFGIILVTMVWLDDSSANALKEYQELFEEIWEGKK